MSMWNTPIQKKPSLPPVVISDDLAVKIREAGRNAKVDPKWIQMFKPRYPTFEQLHTPLY